MRMAHSGVVLLYTEIQARTWGPSGRREAGELKVFADWMAKKR